MRSSRPRTPLAARNMLARCAPNDSEVTIRESKVSRVVASGTARVRRSVCWSEWENGWASRGPRRSASPPRSSYTRSASRLVSPGANPTLSSADRLSLLTSALGGSTASTTAETRCLSIRSATPFRERSLRRADLPDRPVAGLGARGQLGAAVSGIGAVLRDASLDEQVGDAAYGLPAHPHPPSDLGQCAGLVEHTSQHLPPGRGQSTLGSESLRGLHQAGVQPERLQHQLGHGRAGLRDVRVVRPGAAGRGAHAAINTGNPLAFAAVEDRLVGLQPLLRHQAQHAQRRPGELDRRLGAAVTRPSATTARWST